MDREGEAVAEVNGGLGLLLGLGQGPAPPNIDLKSQV